MAMAEAPMAMALVILRVNMVWPFRLVIVISGLISRCADSLRTAWDGAGRFL
jgi:hypothetical protein